MWDLQITSQHFKPLGHPAFLFVSPFATVPCKSSTCTEVGIEKAQRRVTIYHVTKTTNHNEAEGKCFFHENNVSEYLQTREAKYGFPNKCLLEFTVLQLIK